MMKHHVLIVGIISIGLASSLACSTEKKAQSAASRGGSADQSAGQPATLASGSATSPAVKAPASPAEAASATEPASPSSLATAAADSSGSGGLGGLASVLGASGFSSAQIGKFLATPAGAAVFSQLLSNPAISSATGIPQSVLTNVGNNSQLIATLLQNPQISSAIDQGLAKLMAQDPNLLPKILSAVGSGSVGSLLGQPASGTPSTSAK